MPKRLDFNKQTLSTIFMEEYLKQLELAQEGDQKAISNLLSELEEGKVLQDNPLLKLKLQIQLSELTDDIIFQQLFAIKAYKELDKPLYFEPDYIKKEKEEKKNIELQKAKIVSEEEEQKLVDYIRETKQQTISSILNDMTFVEGGSFLMGDPYDPTNLPHIVEVKPFWIKRGSISESEMDDLQFTASPLEAVSFCNRLSDIIGVEFQLPSREQLEFAIKSEQCFKGGYKMISDGNVAIDYNLRLSEELPAGITHFNIVCFSPESCSFMETYNRKKEEEAKLQAEQKEKEQERRRLEEEEQKRKAQEELERLRREKEEQERKAIEEEEERAKKEANEKRMALEEEECKLIERIKNEEQGVISSIIKDMIYVEGGSFLMDNKKDPRNPSRIVEVNPYWIKKNDLSEDEIWRIAKQSSSFHHLFLSRLSKVLGLQFQLPSHEQLEYAVKAKMCKMSKEYYNLIEDGSQSLDYKLCKHSNNDHYTIIDTRFKIVCSSPEFRLIFEDYKKKEDEEKREKEMKYEALWHSVVDEYLNNIVCYKYEEKGFFTKKTIQIRFLSKPLTWRVWNAFMNRDSFEEWAIKDLQKKNKDNCIPNSYSDIRKYNLDVFLNKLNEYKTGDLVYDFIFNNKKLEEKLLKESIIDKGVYLYIKEK